MYAIVLTLDTQLGLAELVHKRYRSLWPSHPFTFRIPFNGTATGTALAYLDRQPDCELVRADRAIGASMAALLDGVADQTWVFWCIDDRFPTWVDAPALDRLETGLGGAATEGVEEVKLIRWKDRLATSRPVELCGVEFHHQAAGTRRWGFWHHHFVRAGTLRAVFGGPRLNRAGIEGVFGPPAPLRRYLLPSRPLAADREVFRAKALVPARPLVRLGEPLTGGRLTRNGRAELRRWNCEVPPYAATELSITYP